MCVQAAFSRDQQDEHREGVDAAMEVVMQQQGRAALKVAKRRAQHAAS